MKNTHFMKKVITKKSGFFGLKLTALLFTLLLLSGQSWGQYGGTGTFTKITSDAELTDGYYVIAYGTTFAMNNTYTSSTYFGNTAISPSSNVITNPAASIVWKITTDGSGRTIYNEGIALYASYTGSANNIQAVASVSTDNQRWTIAWSTSVFTIINKAVPARYLQYNTTSPRFACYTGSQQNITLYKMASAAPTITVNPSTITGFTYMLGSGPSAEQTFTISGSSLTNDISIAASANYEISKTSGSGYTTPLTFAQSVGTVASTTVYVRLKSGLNVGTYNSETITASSTGATDKTVTCSGSVTAIPSITLADNSPQVTAANVNQGTANHVIHNPHLP